MPLAMATIATNRSVSRCSSWASSTRRWDSVTKSASERATVWNDRLGLLSADSGGGEPLDGSVGVQAHGHGSILPDWANRVALARADFDDVSNAAGLYLPGYWPHPLKGDLKGHWSISISGNWRITFRFEDGDAYDVDLTDYH